MTRYFRQVKVFHYVFIVVKFFIEFFSFHIVPFLLHEPFGKK